MPKTNQKACLSTGHIVQILFFSASGSHDIVENAEENVDEINIQGIGTIDSQIGTRCKTTRICDLFYMIDIDSRHDENDAENDKVRNPINHFRLKEEIDQRYSNDTNDQRKDEGDQDAQRFLCDKAK